MMAARRSTPRAMESTGGSNRQQQKMNGGSARKQIAEKQSDAHQDSAAVQRVRQAAQRPQSRFVHARDNDLAVGEFEQAGRVAIEHRGHHALRRKQDGKPGLAQRMGERKIVADRTVPEFQHVALLEAFPANRRAASPAEIVVMLAEIGRGGRIPGRSQRAPESAGLREKPAKRRHRAEIGIRQRRHEARQPAPAGAPVGIRKHVNVKSFRGLQNAARRLFTFSPQSVRAARR